MLAGMEKYGKGSVMQIATVFGPFCHVFYGREILNGILQTFIQSSFWETIIWEIQRLLGASFF